MIIKIDKDTIAKFIRCVFKSPKKHPDRIQVDVNTGCNLKCKMCPVVALGVKPQFMNIETARRVASSFPYAKIFFLTGLGEPLLNPLFAEIVTIFKNLNKKAILCTTTNGFYLTPDCFNKIVNAGINKITVSLDSVNLENDAMVGHVTDESVLQNIKDISKLNHNVELIIQTVLTKELVDNYKDIIDFAAQCKINCINLVRLNNLWRDVVIEYYNGNVDIHKLALKQERELVKAIKQYGRNNKIQVNFLNYNSPIENIALHIATHRDCYCIRLDSDFFVNVSGQASVCCALPDNYIGLIDGPDSVSTIWHSEEMKAYRIGKSICKKCDLVKVLQAESAFVDK